MPVIPTPISESSLWFVFLTGLSVGGVSCIAVQGGLLASTIAQRAKRHAEGGASSAPATARAAPVAQFMVAKLVAYTAFGAALGALGALVSPRAQGVLLVAAAAFMGVVALQQYHTHPLLRRIAFQPPKRAQRTVRAISRRGDGLGPWLLGAATVLIPCGVTLAMEGLAVASGSALRGAAIMAAFTLGTAPLFVALGLFATGLSGAAYRLFKPLAAASLILVAVLTLRGGLRLLGVAGGLDTGPAIEARLPGADVGGAPAAQSVAIRVEDAGYVPDALRVQAGRPTRLTLSTERVTGCTRSFTVPDLGIRETLPITGETVVELPPLAPGKVAFMCGMGMFGGVIEAVP